jgi:hypothetical protein
MFINNKIINDKIENKHSPHPQPVPPPPPPPPSKVPTNNLETYPPLNTNISKDNFVLDFTKPQYKYTTVFQIKADIQYDIYNLYVFGKNKTPIFYNVAYVPNYKSSVFLNGLFRRIRENKNLDYIEESDDEDDFENIQEDKYVDLNKTLLMECIFNNKFKKWIPIKVVDKKSKVVHINSLVKYR